MFSRAGLLVVLSLAGCPENMTPMTPQDPMVRLTLIAEGFTSPLALVEPDDGSGRLFVADQVGLVRVVSANGSLLPDPFLDVRGEMVPLMTGFDERGLLSIVFHPEYADNGRFFVCYNVPLAPEDDPEFNSRLRLSEFGVSAADPDAADPASEVVLLEIVKPQFNHNGGQLAFGPDGMLYMSVGDGGGGNDVGPGHTPELGNGQDTSNLLGTILRLDVSTLGEVRVPDDNPFTSDDEVRDEIYAYGFRNPWRFSFDAGGARRLFCADAGQDLFEEVNVVERGGNHGWNIREAGHCFDPDNALTPPADCPDTGARGEPLLDPIIEYSHFDAGGNVARLVVIGGYIYRGDALPDFVGEYFYADWSSDFAAGDGTLFIAEEDDNGAWTSSEVRIASETSGRVNRFILGFGQDRAGEVYLLTSESPGPAGETGQVFRLSPP